MQHIKNYAVGRIRRERHEGRQYLVAPNAGSDFLRAKK